MIARRMPAWPAALAGCLLLGACGLGADRTGFVTSTNAGVNIQTVPPVAEVSFARREGVVQPVFEGGRHLPVAASIRFGTGLLGGPTAIGSVFVGGAAAQAITAQEPPSNAELDRLATICLSRAPEANGQPVLPGPGAVRSFVFGTNTLFGLAVSWADPASALPDSFRLGYHRQEAALAPLFGAEGGCNGSADDATRRYLVGMPSFLATVRASASASAAGQGAADVAQVFATGSAATNLARRRDIRGAFVQGVAEEVQRNIGGAYTGDGTSVCIDRWLGDGAQRERRLTEIQAWMRDNGIGGRAAPWLDRETPEAVGQRRRFIESKGNEMSC